MNSSRYLCIWTICLTLLAGCARIEEPIQTALSAITRCEEKTEYRFALSSVSNPLANFSATLVGGTSSRISGTCEPATPPATSTLVPEHSITRSSSDLTVKVGTESVLALKISGTSLSGTIQDSCKNGNRAVHTIESGVISSSPKEMRITVATRVDLRSCP